MGAQKIRPQGGLPSDTKDNLKKVNAFKTTSGLQLKEAKPEYVSNAATSDESIKNKESGQRKIYK